MMLSIFLQIVILMASEAMKSLRHLVFSLCTGVQLYIRMCVDHVLFAYISMIIVTCTILNCCVKQPHGTQE